MKSLNSYLNEVRLIQDVKKGTFTAGGTINTRLIIFDIDDTLLVSDTKVFVMKDGEIIKELSAADFNEYKLGPGESFDFSDFMDINSLRRGYFTRYINTLKKAYEKGIHICLLTARETTDMIRDFFLENGIDIKPELVIAVNDPKQPYHGSVSQRKAQAIEALVRQGGYKQIIFFDDNKANLKQAKKLSSKLGIDVRTVRVNIHALEESEEEFKLIPINEAILTGEEVSLASMIWMCLGGLATMGLAVTGRLINSMIKTMIDKKEGYKRNVNMLELKELVKDIDMSDDKVAVSIMNKPGMWSSTEIMELQQHLKDKMTSEQAEKYDEIMQKIMNNKAIINGL